MQLLETLSSSLLYMFRALLDHLIGYIKEFICNDARSYEYKISATRCVITHNSTVLKSLLL